MLINEASVIAELVDAFAAHGIIVDPADITESSKPKRIRADGDGPKVKDAWFVLHLDGRPAGSFGHHSKYPGETFKFLSKAERTPETADQRRARLEKQERDKEAKEAEQRRRSARAEEDARRILTLAVLYSHDEHAKLNAHFGRRDIVDARGVMFGDFPTFDSVTGKRIVIPNTALVPMLDVDGNLRSVQAIFNDADNVLGRDRTYLPGTQKTGLFFSIGDIKQVDGADVIIVCEGVATGLQIWRATGHAVRVAFDAGNLGPVAQALRGAHLDATIIMAGDHDRWKTPGKNPGLKAMFQAAAAVGGMPIWPPFMESDGRVNAEGKLRGGTDWDDYFRLRGAASVREIFDAVFRQVRSAKREAQEAIDRARAAALRAKLPVFADMRALGTVDLGHGSLEKHLRNLASLAAANAGADDLYHKVAVSARSIALKRVQTIPVQMTADRLVALIGATGAPLHEDTLAAMRDELNAECAKRKARGLARSGVSLPVSRNHDYQLVEELPLLTASDYTGVILIRAPMGAGKTKNIGVPFAEYGKTFGGDARFVALVHRVSLVAELAERLALKHYTRDGITFANSVDVNGLAVCLPSITLESLRQIIGNCRYLFIDEIAQVLEFTQSKECSNGGKRGSRQAIYEALKELVKRATCIIGADAGLNDAVVKFLEECRPDEAFRIFDVRAQPSGIKIKFGHGGRAVKQLHAEARNLLDAGKNIWVPCESKTQAELIYEQLKRHSPDKKILLITATTAGRPEQVAFLANAEVESRKYNAVVHSPTISSGMSIEHRDGDPHFDHVLFIGGGFAITPADAAQMMRRVRRATTFTVATQQNNTRQIKDAADIGAAQEASAAREGRPDCVTPFGMHCNRIVANRRAAQANFAAELYWLLEAAGHTVGDTHQTDEQIDAEILSTIRAELVEADRAAILSARDLTDDDAEALRRAGNQSLSEEDHHALTRYGIKRFLGEDVFEWDRVWDAWDNGRGPPKWDRFLAAYDEVADTRDRGVNLEDRTFKKARVRAYQVLFAGITIEPGMILTRDDAIRICERAIADRMEFAEDGIIPGRYGLKIGAGKLFPSPKEPMIDALDVFAKIGLGFERHPHHDGRYVLRDASFAFARQCSARRRAAMLGVAFVEPAAPAPLPTLAERIQAQQTHGRAGVSPCVVDAGALFELVTATVPKDQKITRNALATALTDLGMVQFSKAFKWRKRTVSVWVVADLAGSTNDAVRDALDATLSEVGTSHIGPFLKAYTRNDHKCEVPTSSETTIRKDVESDGFEGLDASWIPDVVIVGDRNDVPTD